MPKIIVIFIQPLPYQIFLYNIYFVTATGYYLYAESSSTRATGEYTDLLSPPLVKPANSQIRVRIM